MIYLDTSLLVSLYCLDANSQAAAALVARTRKPLLVTNLCELEAINAFNLRLFRKEITAGLAEISRQHLADDLRDGVYEYRTIPELAYVRARMLSQDWTPALGTRTADLLHIAAALELKATAFYSFDAQQLRAAEAAGLPVAPSSRPKQKKLRTNKIPHLARRRWGVLVCAQARLTPEGLRLPSS